MPASRLAVIQPVASSTFLARRAQAEPEVFADRDRRLDLAGPDFDPALKRRQIVEYAQHLCGLLKLAGAAGVDLALLPECTLPIGSPQPAARDRMGEVCGVAEGIWLDMTAPLARRHRMLIAGCYYRREGEHLYNDAVLMDERGEVAGIYHKVHLPCPLDWPMSEASTFTAGNHYPVFETRVGRLGFQICYDIAFPEGSGCLGLNGADCILHPTVGYAFPDEEEAVAEGRLRTRATDNHVALMYANFGPTPGRSAIYTHSGNQIACCGRGEDTLVCADIDLRAPRMQKWAGYGTHDHRDQLARKRRPDTYGVLVERRPPLLKGATGPEGRLYEYPVEVGLDQPPGVDPCIIAAGDRLHPMKRPE